MILTANISPDVLNNPPDIAHVRIYIYCGKTKIEVIEHFADNRKAMNTLVEDVITYTAHKDVKIDGFVLKKTRVYDIIETGKYRKRGGVSRENHYVIFSTGGFLMNRTI